MAQLPFLKHMKRDSRVINALHTTWMAVSSCALDLYETLSYIMLSCPASPAIHEIETYLMRVIQENQDTNVARWKLIKCIS